MKRLWGRWKRLWGRWKRRWCRWFHRGIRVVMSDDREAWAIATKLETPERAYLPVRCRRCGRLGFLVSETTYAVAE